MIFYSKLLKPKKIHIEESVINRLKNIFENSEDEGGIFHVQDIDNKKTMDSFYEYLPNDDFVYTDFTDYAKKNNLINKDNLTFDDSARKTPYSNIKGMETKIPLRHRIGLGDIVKTPENMNIDKVPVDAGETIDCFNLSMLGKNIQTLIAHTYKGKKAAYPGEHGYYLKVIGTNGEERPNLIQGEYAKKLAELVNNYKPLKDFNPQWIIFPESSSPFNDYIAEFLINSGAFKNAKLIPNGTLVKTDFWGIDYNNLIEFGLKEIATRSSDFNNCYSKFKELRDEYLKEYFLQQLTDILVPRVCKLIPEYRKMYYLENYTKDREIELTDGRTVKLWPLINDQSKKNANHKNDIKSKYNYYEGRKVYGLSRYGKLLSEAVAATNPRTPEEIDADLKSRPEIWNNHTDRDENKFFDKFKKQREKTLSDLEREAEIAREEQNSKTLVNIEDVPTIENALKVIDKKYGTNELNTMYSYISSNNMDENEREYIINSIHEYFLDEINKFNQAARTAGLPVNFENARVSEEILMDMFREILAHNKATTIKNLKNEKETLDAMIKFNDGSDTSNAGLGSYLSNINSLVEAFKKGVFSLNMNTVIKLANSTDTVKNYPYVSRMSLFNQFDLSDKIKQYPVKPNDRILIIDDNYSTGASFKNAANVIHEKLGLPYSNIKALTPGDMGTASLGGRRGPGVAFNAAEANLLRKYKRGEFNDILNQKITYKAKKKNENEGNDDELDYNKIENNEEYTVETTVGKYLKDRVKYIANKTYDRDNKLKAAQLGEKGLSDTSDDFSLDDVNFDYNSITPFDFDDKNKIFSTFLLPATIEIKKKRKLETLDAILRNIRKKQKEYNKTSDVEEKAELETRIDDLYTLYDKKLAELSMDTSKAIMKEIQKDPELAEKVIRNLEYYESKRSEIIEKAKALIERRNNDVTWSDNDEADFQVVRNRLRSNFNNCNNKVIEFGGKGTIFPSSGPRGRRPNVLNKEYAKEKAQQQQQQQVLAANTVQSTTVQTPRRPKIDTSIPLPDPEKEAERRKLLDNLGKLRKDIAFLNSKINNGSLLRDPNRDEWIRNRAEKIAEREKIQDDIYNLTANCLQNIQQQTPVQQQAPVKQTPPVQQQEHLPGAPNVIFKGPARERKIYRTVDEVKEDIIKASKYTIDELEAMCRNYRLPLETLNDAIETLHKYVYGNASSYINSDIIKSCPEGIDSEEHAYFSEDWEIRKALLSKLKDKRKRKLKKAA